MLISNDNCCRIYLFQDVKVHSLVTRPQEDWCCSLPDLNFHRGQTESLPSNYYIRGITCIMTSMYRVILLSVHYSCSYCCKLNYYNFLGTLLTCMDTKSKHDRWQRIILLRVFVDLYEQDWLVYTSNEPVDKRTTECKHSTNFCTIYSVLYKEVAPIWQSGIPDIAALQQT